MILTTDHGEQIDHRHTGKGKSKHTGKGKGNHVDVVETIQRSETASSMSAIESGDADESMDMARTEAEAWRLIHSRYAQNTTELISGSLLHDLADKHNQLPDESKEQKQTEDLAGIQAHHHEQQILLPRSLDEYQTKFRDEHNDFTKTMKDLSIIQHQTELEEKADNEQQLRRELSMVAQDNDAKHLTKRTTISGFTMRTSKNTRNLMNRSKHTSHLHRRFWIRRSSKNWIAWLRTHTEKHCII